MLIQGQVGAPAGTQVAGSTPAVRQGQLGDVVISGLHPRYYEQTYRRNMFSGANSAFTVTASGITTATQYNGMVLYNPPSSPVNLVVQKVAITSIVQQSSAIAVGIGQGFSVLPPSGTLTTVAVKNNYVTGPAPVGQLYGQATFGISTTNPITTTFTHDIGVLTTGTTATSIITPVMLDTEGTIVIPPTGFAVLYFSSASVASSIAASFAWEEVPIEAR